LAIEKLKINYKDQK